MFLRLLSSLLILGGILAIPLAGRADDDLSRFVEQNRLLAQKVKTDAAAAIAQARALEKADPEQAQALLQKALRQVQNSTVLAAGEQTQLTVQLLGRIREVGEIARQQKVAGKQAPLQELPRNPGIETPAKNPASVAEKFIDSTGASVGAAARIQDDKNKGFSGAIGGIAKSSIPQGEDVNFPKDWASKTKLREKYAGPVLSPKEIALVKALNSVMSVDFNETPLKTVLEVLQDRTGQAIIVDLASLKEANTDYTDPVTFKVNKAQFSTILRKVLRDNGLTYVIREGTLQVVTAAKAREMMTVRTYPISDLVQSGSLGQQFGPFVARAQMLNNVQGLILMIQNSVDPSIWQANGGSASITFSEPGMALIIRAPTEFHYQFGGGGR
jgi:hypothetical protein